MMCAYTRPRYQMRVFRTIGPLVAKHLLFNSESSSLCFNLLWQYSRVYVEPGRQPRRKVSQDAANMVHVH